MDIYAINRLILTKLPITKADFQDQTYWYFMGNPYLPKLLSVSGFGFETMCHNLAC